MTKFDSSQIEQLDLFNLQLMLNVSFGGQISNLISFLQINIESLEESADFGVPSEISDAVMSKLNLDINDLWVMDLPDEYGNPTDLPKSNFYKLSAGQRLLSNLNTIVQEIFNNSCDLLLKYLALPVDKYSDIVFDLENERENQYTSALVNELNDRLCCTANCPISDATIQYLKDIVVIDSELVSEVSEDIESEVGKQIPAESLLTSEDENCMSAEQISNLKISNIAFKLDSSNTYEIHRSLPEYFGAGELNNEFISLFESYCITIISTLMNRALNEPAYLSSPTMNEYDQSKSPLAYSLENYSKVYLGNVLSRLKHKDPVTGEDLHKSYTKAFYENLQKKMRIISLLDDKPELSLADFAPKTMEFPAKFEVVEVLYNVFGSTKDEDRYQLMLPHFVCGFDTKLISKSSGLPFAYHIKKLTENYQHVVAVGDRLLNDEPLTEDDILHIGAIMAVRAREEGTPKTHSVLVEYGVNGNTKQIDITQKTGVAQGNVSRTIVRFNDFKERIKYAARVLKSVYCIKE
ncbi:hypothetical protein ACVP6W_002273 [Vibrio cholerae]